MDWDVKRLKFPVEFFPSFGNKLVTYLIKICYNVTEGGFILNKYETIGRLLKEARERCGLTQEQAARYLGVVREIMSYYENGRREIDLLSIKRLADLYGYDIVHFLAEPNSIAFETTALAFRADELNEKDLEIVAWAQRVVRNLQELDELLSGEQI